jgi:hypothetical protein
MPCTSLTELPRECGAEGIIGGVGKVYMMAYVDSKPLVTSPTNDIYVLTPAGMVSDLGRDTGKMFVEIGTLPATSGLNEELTKNKQNGSAFFTQTLNLVLSQITTANRTFVANTLNQPVLVLVRTRNGNYYMGGLGGQLELTTLTGGTGVADGDLQGYTITYTGTEAILIPPVDPTLVPTLLIAAP